MFLNPEIDSFSFRFQVPGSSCTKRIILSTVARCYDPVGLVAPFILYSKRSIKELWKFKIGWDDMVPNEIHQMWSKLKDEWSAFEKIQFSRYMGTVRTSPVMLVAFADASMDVYGAVVYVRTVTENEEITVNLLCVESKVSPFRVVTIPRLKLVADLLSSRDLGKDVDSIKCIVSTEDPETHPLYDMVMRSSSYITILRVTVWVLRFVKILTVKNFITSSDMNRAELVLVRIVQGKYFKPDIKLLNLGKEISNRLRKLNPFLQNEIIMMGGKFPADAHEKAVWLEKLGLKEFTETVSKYARIRSIHFKGEAFEIKPSGKIFLRKGAFLMKSIFQQLKLLQPRDNRKSSTDSTDTAPGTSCSDIIDSFGPPLKRFHSDTSATMTAPEIDTEYLSETLTASETELIQMSITEKETDRPTISQKKKAVTDLSTSDFSTPRKARRNFRSMKKTVLCQKTKIKTLQQSVRRLRSKVTNLNSLINHLKSKSLVHEDCETSLRASISESTSELFKRMLKGSRTQKLYMYTLLFLVDEEWISINAVKIEDDGALKSPTSEPVSVAEPSSLTSSNSGRI
ncbi:hypothetical protein JTB14_013025 [Gonioctena quinquepunctata]|nr:hypothetical protein JTB14_013025 [Gonioctena quinquepunctata]